MGAYRETECGAFSRNVVVDEHSTCRKLKSVQMRVGGDCSGQSIMAGGQGDLEWKLEERMEEIKELFGKRLEGMEERLGEGGGEEIKSGWRNWVEGTV